MTKFFLSQPRKKIHLLLAKHYFRTSRAAIAHRHLAIAAKLGSAQAAYELGFCYHHGLGCLRSGSEAIKWYSVAANLGNADAQFELGVTLLNDHDLDWLAGNAASWAGNALQKGSQAAKLVFSETKVLRDEPRAYELLHASALQGKAEAQANIGWLLLKGIGCEINYKRAEEWFCLAVEQQKLHQAALGLFELYTNESSGCFDSAKALDWLRTAADLGNVTAAYKFGAILRDDPQEAENFDEARHYLRLAATKGHGLAVYELALLLLEDEDRSASFNEAIELLRVAAKAQNPMAAYKLGFIYASGSGSVPDHREASHWFRLAADLGLPDAQFQIGCRFARGEGVSADTKLAAKYFLLAAENGHPLAALNIGIFLENGQGICQDVSAAASWFTFAAGKGIAQAHLHLARQKFVRRAESRDSRDLISHLTAASEAGFADAKLMLIRLYLENGDASDHDKLASLLRGLLEDKSVIAAEMCLQLASQIVPARPLISSALSIIQRAAQSGSHQAMLCLAREYLSGANIGQDSSKAEILLKELVQGGSPWGCFELGVFYCKRNSSASDITEGLRLYTLAADLGHNIAQFNAGIMYLNGVGAQRDLERAVHYLSLASSQGFGKAAELLKAVESNPNIQTVRAAVVG